MDLEGIKRRGRDIESEVGSRKMVRTFEVVVCLVVGVKWVSGDSFLRAVICRGLAANFSSD